MNTATIKRQSRLKRKKRIRKKLSGTPERPRLSVFRSSRHIYAQIVDDVSGHTLTAASSLEKTSKEENGLKNNVAMARFVGKLVGERAVEKGIQSILFDRNGFLYHGRVRAVSEGAREAGLDF